MKRRKFIKTSSFLVTGSILTSQAKCMKSESRKNWAGNYEYQAEKLHRPESVEQIQELVRKSEKLRVLGTRHSFNGIADSKTNQLSLLHRNQVIGLDKAARTVTVDAAMRYGELATYLDENGYALHNLASLPHISIAGACSTATHGSGDRNGNLATAVSGMEMITADGKLVQLSRAKDGEKFHGAVVGLGSLGVVTRLTLDIQPTYQMTQTVYQNLPLDQLANHFEEIFSSGYSVSLFTDWQNRKINQVWVKRRTTGEARADQQPEFHGAKIATRHLHPIEELSAVNCTEQMGVPGPWYERLPHFRMNFTPSSGKELQSEFFVPRERALAAILALHDMSEQIFRLLQITEIRTIAADQLWMSPCYQQPCVAIHFTWKQDWPALQQLLPQIESKLAPYEARPHWGKIFTISSQRLQSLYPKLADFKELMTDLDPSGKFRNEFIEANLFG